MNERVIEIKKIVNDLYNSSNLPNANLDNWNKYALDKYLNSSLSIEEISASLQAELRRKILIEEIKNNNFKKYHILTKVADSIGNVPESDIESLLVDLYSSINTINDKELVRIAILRFEKYRNINTEIDHNTPQLIQSILSNEATKNLLTRILSNESTIGYHTKETLDGAWLAHNILVTGKVLEFITKYLIIHRQPFDMSDLYAKIAEANINEMDEVQLQSFFNKTILLSLQKRMGLKDVNSTDSKQQIADFIYQNYIENGYCFQGINGKYRDSVSLNGISSKFSEQSITDLNEINRIFKSHGLDKIFFSKLDETRIAPYYYLSDSMSTAYHYSYHNPEWFSYFVATGNNMPDKEYDRTAYYRRDYEACKKNVTKLCAQYNLSVDETNFVISKFCDLWDNVVAEGKDNIIAFIQRNLINRNQTSLDMSLLESKTALEIVSELLKSNYDIDMQFLDIPKEKVDVIDVPSIFSLYDKEKFNDYSRRKYIKLANGSKFYYDILIHADDVDFDCISITDDLTPTKRVKQSNIGKPIDVVCCSNNIDRESLLNNGHSSFQSLEMMIAVNGIANSEAGKGLLEKSRADYSPEYMKNYYYHLCELFCKIASDESYSTQQRASALVRMAKDIYPKAELMRYTNRYPQFINEDKKVYSYLTYEERLLLEKVKTMRNSADFIDNEALRQFTAIFQAKLKGKIDQSFTEEFNNQIERMIHYKKKHISDSTVESQNISMEALVLNAMSNQLTIRDLNNASNYEKDINGRDENNTKNLGED